MAPADGEEVVEGRCEEAVASNGGGTERGAAPASGARHPWSTILPWAPRLAALALAGAPLAVLYYLFWTRLGYGGDLEWMEGAVLVHGKRVMEGQPLYGPPSADFASFLYTPLYPWLLAACGKIFGLSYTLGRALSVLAFTTTLGFVVRACLRAGEEAGPPADRCSSSMKRAFSMDAIVFAAVALGAMATAYDFTGGWYDLVRGDTMQLALSAGGLYVLGVQGRSARGTVVAATLLGLGFLAKQTAVFPILAAGLAMPLVCLRHLPLLVGVVGAVAGLGSLLLNHLTDGWFWFYVYELHQAHRTDATQLWEKVPSVLWSHGRWLYCGCLAAAVLWIVATVWRRRFFAQGPLWLLAALAGLAAAAVGRATQWSHENAYIPGVVFPAAFLAIASAEARALLHPPPAELSSLDGWRARLNDLAWLRAALPWAPIGLGLVHLAVTALPDVRRHAPDARARAEVAELRRTLARLGREGEIYVPYHPFYSVLASGPGHGHVMNVNDVDVTRPARQDRRGLLGDGAARRKRVMAARRGLMDSLRERLASGRFAFVLHDRAVISGWRQVGVHAAPLVDYRYASQVPGLLSHYRLERDLIWDRASPRTRTGNPCAPRHLWVRIAPARPPAGARVVFDFETVGLEGWSVEGTAFGRGPISGLLWDPRRRQAQGLVAGAGGRRWLSSFHGGDAAVGRLGSPPFRLDRPALWLRVGGGRDAKRLRVSLLVGGRTVATATGGQSERFRTVRWDVSPYAGHQAVIEVVDESTVSWGHIQLDEVWLVPALARSDSERPVRVGMVGSEDTR